LLLARNVIYDNRAAYTAGLYLLSVSPLTVTNNIIVGNISEYEEWENHPAVRVCGGGGQWLHNTIARNRTVYGIQVDTGASVALTNTILVSHTVGITVAGDSTAALEATVWGSGTWANGADLGGEGAIFIGTVNVWGDPGFVSPAAGDYHIGPGSAAKDAGIDAGVAIDIDGRARPIGAGYDIGADEYAAPIYLPLVMRKS